MRPRRRARDEARYLIDREIRAVRSTLSLAAGDAGYDQMQALADRLSADLETRLKAELERIEAVAGLLGRVGARRPAEGGAPSGPAAEASRLVLARRSDSVPPGVAGLSYDETAALVAAMHADDPRVNWETLRIFADELWNFADGRRTLAEIARAVTYEFGFRVPAGHFVTLDRGLEKAGQFRLEAQPL